MKKLELAYILLKTYKHHIFLHDAMQLAIEYKSKNNIF